MKPIQIQKIWLSFFGTWLLLLTGVLDFWIQSPGMKQWYRVQNSLNERRQEIAATEARTYYLQLVSKELESNPVALDREIRKVLGYLGQNEVVFEFVSKN